MNDARVNGGSKKNIRLGSLKKEYTRNEGSRDLQEGAKCQPLKRLCQRRC